MATPNYFDPADIETQARYRPGVASNIFNVLTGGLAGQISGSTQRAQEAARARQALLQEEFGKRDEERAIKRQLFINAIQQGAELDPNATIAQMADDLRKQKIKRDLLQQSGRISAYNEAAGQTPQGMALLADRSSPYFQTAQLAAKADLNEKEAQAALEEKRQTPALRAQLEGLAPGTYIPPQATAGQLRGMIQATQYKLPMQMRQESEVGAVADLFATNPNLKAFEGYTPEKIQSVAPGLAKSLLARANKELTETADAQNKKRKADATKMFAAILQLPADQRRLPENAAKLNELAPDVPSYYTQDPKFKAAVGLGEPLDDKQLETIMNYDRSLAGINRFVSVLGEVAKTPGGISKFQNTNYGTIKNELNNTRSKFFANDAERELASQLVQEYEGIVSGERKSLFGQSLTLQEGRKSDINFGTPADKNFLNRALEFVDRTTSYDPATFYLNAGKGVPDETIKAIANKKRVFNDFKTKPDVAQLLGVFGRDQQAPQVEQSLLSPEKQAMKRRIEAKARGMYERYLY